MYLTYLRRELLGRTKQSIIVVAGMALAVALVILVSAISAGVKDAQAASLASVYGVGTDVTVSEAQEPGEGGPGGGGGPQSFEFGSDEGTTGADGTRTIAQNSLRTAMGSTAFAASDLDTVLGVDGVSAATATLALQSTSFSGELPATTDGTTAEEGTMPGGGAPGGMPGGGGAFDVDSFDVTGVDPSSSGVGPLTSVELVDGRMLEVGDSGAEVTVLDDAYATSAELAVGDTLEAGDAVLEVVGIVASTSADAETAADAYIPLDTAQALADLDDQVTTIYVSAASADQVDTLQASLETALPDSTVRTQSDLASSVSGSLATAAGLVGGLGTWLSILVLSAAVLISTLFTLSGVTRRTREFGTLKAIGWRDGRIVRQVAGESLVLGLVGGILGVVLGVAASGVVGLIGPTLTSAATAGGMPGGAQAPAGMPSGGMGGGFAETAQSAAEVVLSAPVSIGIVLLAVGLAVAGGLVSGAFGGWRAARLRPAEALRSVG